METKRSSTNELKSLVQQVNGHMRSHMENSIIDKTCNNQSEPGTNQILHHRFLLTFFEKLSSPIEHHSIKPGQEAKTVLQQIEPEAISDSKQNDNSDDDDDNSRRKAFRMGFETLKKQRDVACLKVLQASKALDYLKGSTKLWKMKLITEKVLLESGRSFELLMDGIRSVYYDPKNKKQQLLARNVGTVTLSNFKLKIEKPESKRHIVSFFILLVINDLKVVTSKVVKAKTDHVDFDETIVVDVKSGFKLKLEIYSLVLQEESLGRYLPLGCHISKRMAPLSPEVRRDTKLRFTNVYTNEIEEKTGFKTLFKPQGFTTIDLKTSQKKVWVLKLAPKSVLKNEVSFSFNYERAQAPSKQGFLTVGTKFETGIIWNRRWCSLENSELRVFNSPTELLVPVLVLNLEKCNTSKVEEASSDFCPRPRCLSLNMSRNGTVSNIFFKADTTNDLKEWMACINDNLELIP